MVEHIRTANAEHELQQRTGFQSTETCAPHATRVVCCAWPDKQFIDFDVFGATHLADKLVHMVLKEFNRGEDQGGVAQTSVGTAVSLRLWTKPKTSLEHDGSRLDGAI